MVKKLRIALGVHLKRRLHPNPPAHVKLTAGSPVSGKNYYNVIIGEHHPAGETFMQTPFSITGIGSTRGLLEFHFEPLTAGKAYLLDLTVGGDTKWLVSINSWSKWDLVNVQSGHVLFAMMADGSRAVVRVLPYKSKYGVFFNCQLTRVD